MKRVKAACICQTLHFMLKEDLGHDLAVKTARREVEAYKAKLEKDRVQFRIIEESEQPDGSIIIRIIKQYNSAPVGDYLTAPPVNS